MGNVDHIIAQGDELLELIPHRHPMLMVDSLVKADESEFETTFTIRQGNVLLEDGQLSEAGLIENIAQTSAAGSGQQCIELKMPIPLGFIFAIQKLKINQLPSVGDQIRTRVTVEQKVMNISVVKGIVFLGDVIVAQCNMKLVLQE